MENEENTLDTQEEQQESEPVAEETTEETETSEEGVEPKADRVTLSPAEYRHFKKWQSKKDEPVKVATRPQPVSPPLNVEETVLLANGMPEELLAELKAVAQVRKTTLIKAQTDPIFVEIKDKFEKDQKQKGASLGASRGSGSVKAKKDFATPGLTRDEHYKMVMDSRL